MVNSVINEGARGLQNSQRELLRNASEIARAGTESNGAAGGVATQTNPVEASTIAPVTEASSSNRSGDISEPLVELRRQELLFNASAKVVETGSKTVGSLLDTLA